MNAESCDKHDVDNILTPVQVDVSPNGNFVV